VTIIRDASSSGTESRAPEVLALEALGWALADPARAERLLSLTGLTPDRLRHGIGDRAVQAAVLEFLANHEPDLVLAADALDTTPQALVSAAKELAR
jgi:ethanolamine ammonia-lyase small subunit